MIFISLYQKMTLTQDQISRLSKLTALEEDASISIDSVLESFDTIASIAVDTNMPISRSGSDTLPFRPDIPTQEEGLADALLERSPQRIAAHQIVLSGIMQGE